MFKGQLWLETLTLLPLSTSEPHLFQNKHCPIILNISSQTCFSQDDCYICIRQYKKLIMKKTYF